MDAAGVSQTWIGLNDHANENVWEWANGQENVWENWRAGEPNDYGSGEDCGMLGWAGGHKWNDYFCDRELIPLCQMVPEPTIGRNYVLITDQGKKNWADAKAVCAEHGGLLATVDTEANQELANSVMEAAGKT